MKKTDRSVLSVQALSCSGYDHGWSFPAGTGRAASMVGAGSSHTGDVTSQISSPAGSILSNIPSNDTHTSHPYIWFHFTWEAHSCYVGEHVRAIGKGEDRNGREPTFERPIPFQF